MPNTPAPAPSPSTPAPAPVPAPLVPVPDDAAHGEAAMLARVMARAHGSFVAHFERHYDLSREEAVRKARETVWTPEEELERLDAAPPDALTWHDFNGAMEHAPERAMTRWERLKAEAWEESASGARGCEAVRQDSPWERARYLAVRRGFVEEWRPRGGIELSLIDQLAQTYTGWLHALGQYELLAGSEARRMEKEVDRDSRYRPTTEYRADLEDRALQTADRFQRMFTRTLRALRDLRRYAPHVTIHHAGQVNIGEQQVNVSSTNNAESYERKE